MRGPPSQELPPSEGGRWQPVTPRGTLSHCPQELVLDSGRPWVHLKLLGRQTTSGENKAVGSASGSRCVRGVFSDPRMVESGWPLRWVRFATSAGSGDLPWGPAGPGDAPHPGEGPSLGPCAN